MWLARFELLIFLKTLYVNITGFLGQLIIIAIFAGTDAMTFIDTDHYQNGFLIGTLVSVVFISAMVGLVRGSQAALAALFPPIYMGTFMQVPTQEKPS